MSFSFSHFSNTFIQLETESLFLTPKNLDSIFTHQKLYVPLPPWPPPWPWPMVPVGVLRSLVSSLMSLRSSTIVDPVVSGRWMGDGEVPRGDPGIFCTSFLASSMAFWRFCWLRRDMRLLQRPIWDLKKSKRKLWTKTGRGFKSLIGGNKWKQAEGLTLIEYLQDSLNPVISRVPHI